MTPEQEKLVLKHLKDADRWAKRFCFNHGITGLAKDDVIADGRLGLVMAAKRFEPERGLAFNTYAYFKVFSYITLGIKKWCGDKINSSVGRARYEAIHTRFDNVHNLGNTPKYLHSDHTTQDLENALNGLSAKNRQIIWLYVVEEYKLREIGKKLRITREAVRQRKKISLTYLEMTLNREGKKRVFKAI